MDLTPVEKFKWFFAKREDKAYYAGPDYPSGSKVRQYMEMAKQWPNAPMIVGCSAHSAMQIYVAAAARQTGVRGIVYTAKRKVRTEATEYAARLGTEIVEVRPAYLSVLRSRARERAATLGTVVRWDPELALLDTMAQVANLPPQVKRVVVPTGSGLTVAGVLAGLARQKHKARVLAVAVSDMANRKAILEKARRKAAGGLLVAKLPDFELTYAKGGYGDWAAHKLPDGTILDPYYAAKAYPYLEKGDCLWVPGVRPVAAMPVACVKALDSVQV